MQPRQVALEVSRGTADEPWFPDRGTLVAMGLFSSERTKHAALAKAWVVPEPSRCVQCGICSYHCPMEIDVRRQVWLGKPVKDSHCLTCGECVKRCPRGLLRLQPITAEEPARPRPPEG